MSIGNKIKKLRKEKGLTQEKLGELIGVKKSAVAKYENNRVENLKRATIQKLAEVLEVSPSYFFEDETSIFDIGLDIGTSGIGFAPSHKVEELLSKDSIIRLSKFTDQEREKVDEYILFIDSQRKNN